MPGSDLEVGLFRFGDSTLLVIVVTSTERFERTLRHAALT